MSELAPHRIYASVLQGDERGGNVAPQNILVHNCMTGEKLTSHMATPAPEDPCDPLNVTGAYLQRKKKEISLLRELE